MVTDFPVRSVKKVSFQKKTSPRMSTRESYETYSYNTDPTGKEYILGLTEKVIEVN